MIYTNHSARTLYTVLLIAMATGCPSDDPLPEGPASGTSGGPGQSTGLGDSLTTLDPAVSTSGADSTGDTAMADTTAGSDEGTDGSGSFEGTGPGAMLPDLDMSVVLEPTSLSVFVSTKTFSGDSCEVMEGCAHAAGDRRLPHFDTISPNLGTAAFHVGNPQDNPDLFQIGCHGSYVFKNYGAYRLLSEDGTQVVSTGHKAAFALIDTDMWVPGSGPGPYGFGDDMGISVGWADVYNAGLECQYVDITGVPSGNYLLEISVNFEQQIEESTYDNNVVLVPVTITEDDSPWQCANDYYGTGDGCDCGCGLVDPDCADATVASCDFCAYGCGTTCADIDPTDNSTCI